MGNQDGYNYSDKRKGYKFWIIIGVILLLLAVTNPSKDDYAKWVVHSSIEESSNEWVNAGISLLGGPVIQGITTQKNLVFASIFKMDIGIETTSVLGFGKRFFIRLP
ncbi:hypothetical protein [Paenibacillus silvae]|uniref:DUF4359 domain-containing protein n=1 Tax=Paenibacillus silvae TaxID=1325358 RepID=A0A2W6P7I2_9BACL|nr:hypothetical protein [Paenibacillus silvae]PZT55630.1 hypothetical protein DN757_11135 [Paenibacillus silvae]